MPNNIRKSTKKKKKEEERMIEEIIEIIIDLLTIRGKKKEMKTITKKYMEGTKDDLCM